MDRREYLIIDEEYNKKISKYSDFVKFKCPSRSFEFDYLMKEYIKSPEFDGLSDAEKHLAKTAIKSCYIKPAPWTVNPSDNSGILLEVEPTMEDCAILSGMRGWEIVKQMERNELEKLKKIGNFSLSQCVDLGLSHSMDYGYLSQDLPFEVTDGCTLSRYTVGGTMHGDFAAYLKKFITKGDVIDPSGQKRFFAPELELTYARAYHSVESGMAVAMLGYLARGDENVMEEKKIELIKAIDDADLGRGGGNFADFGDEDLLGISSRIREKYDYKPECTIYEAIVEPVSFLHVMRIVCVEGGIELRNGELTEDQKEFSVNRKMFISEDNIPKFISTMAAANAGRTSLEQIRESIRGAWIQN